MLVTNDLAVIRGLDSKAIGWDFDGVIHSYERDYGDGSIYGTVIAGVKTALRLCKEAGYLNVVQSFRVAEQIGPWLEEQGLDRFIDVVTNCKPRAKVYIDDHALRFNGPGDVMLWLFREEGPVVGDAFENGAASDVPDLLAAISDLSNIIHRETKDKASYILAPALSIDDPSIDAQAPLLSHPAFDGRDPIMHPVFMYESDHSENIVVCADREDAMATGFYTPETEGEWREQPMAHALSFEAVSPAGKWWTDRARELYAAKPGKLLVLSVIEDGDVADIGVYFSWFEVAFDDQFRSDVKKEWVPVAAAPDVYHKLDGPCCDWTDLAKEYRRFVLGNPTEDSPAGSDI